MAPIFPEELLGPGGPSPVGLGPGGPPPTIDLPQEEAAPARGGDPSELVRQALDLLHQALVAEKDDEDTLVLEQMTTLGQKYLAQQQKLGDQATGAGPGVKLVRKSAQ